VRLEYSTLIPANSWLKRLTGPCPLIFAPLQRTANNRPLEYQFDQLVNSCKSFGVAGNPTMFQEDVERSALRP